MLVVNNIMKAREAVKEHVYETPLLRSDSLSALTGADLWLKCENVQKTGSFKVRGAFNRLLGLKKGTNVSVASRGNHAQAVACAASELGLHSKIYMPGTAPLAKQLAVKSYGGELVLQGQTLSESLDMACSEKGCVFVHPFDDELVMAGQGTLGLELDGVIEAPDYVLVPVGGGGLISGVSVAVKSFWPKTRVIGVQSDAATSATESFSSRKQVERPSGSTIADGVAVGRVGGLCLEVMLRYVDGMVSVSDEAIAEAVLMLLERKRLLAEGAGALGLAYLMENPEEFAGKRVVVVISDGNMDITLIEKILHMGLSRSGRVMAVDVVLGDEPGALSRASGIIAQSRGNILNVYHDNLDPDIPFKKTHVRFIVETLGSGHGVEIVEALRSSGIEVRQSSN